MCPCALAALGAYCVLGSVGTLSSLLFSFAPQQFMDTKWTSTRGTDKAYPLGVGEAQGGMIGKDFVITSGFYNTVKVATPQTWAIDTSDPSATWRRQDDMPITLGVTHCATVIIGTKIYLLGGYLGGNLGTDGVGQEVDDVLVYDHSKPTGEQWSRLPNLPAGRAGGGAFYDSNANAILFGTGAVRPKSGSRFAVDYDDTWMYSFNNPGAGWVQKASTIFKANHMQFVTAIDPNGAERHYFVGGQEGEDEANGNIGDLAEYNFEANQWTKRADMPIPRSHATSSTRAYGCGFLIITGTTNGASRTPDVSYYEPATDTWTKIGDVPGNGLNTPVCDINTVDGQDWLFCETGWVATDWSYKMRIERV